MDQKQEQKENLKYFIRVCNTDLNGNKRIEHALTNIKGVGFSFAHAICLVLNLDGNTKAGYIDDVTAKKMEEVMRNPLKYNIPSWVFNRQKDPETGNDVHLVTGDLTFVTDNDLKMMKKIKSYKGLRHMKGLTVRGQRTKSNFRKNKGKANRGVKRRPGAKTGKV